MPAGPYILDTNVFLQASKSYYPMDVALGFWSKLHQLASQGKIISIDKVKGELYTNPDALTNWIDTNLPVEFFHDSSGVIPEYTRVCAWAVSRSLHYTSGAVNTFLQQNVADAWIISYSLQSSLPIVTYETSDPNRRSSIKIPDACTPLGIRCLTAIEMFRELSETF